MLFTLEYTHLIIHAGTYDISLRQSEVLRADVSQLLLALNQLNISNTWLSGPVPEGKDERFSRIRSLHKWMKTKCLETSIGNVSNFKVFGSASLFKENQRYLNRAGIKLLAANIFAHLNNTPRLSKPSLPKVSASTQPTDKLPDGASNC